MKKTIVYSIINQKGGVGKSTTAQALAAGLSRKGKKVLVVDLDPQGNTTTTLGGKKDRVNALSLLLEEADPEESIQKIDCGDLIASTKALASADTLLTETGKEYKLKEALDPIKGKYDFVLIDTPPALGILTINALVVSDRAIIPAQADVYSLEGIADIAGTIKTVKKYCNSALTVEGILLTRYTARGGFNEECEDLAREMAASMNTKVFDTHIRENIAVKKAQAAKKNIFDYDAKSTAAASYAELIEEILKPHGKK